MTAEIPVDQSKGTFTVAGADGQPVVILSGQWYMTPKARTQRMMKNSLTSEARQVYACLELATMGFRQELAVTMDKGRIITLRSEHLCRDTGLSKQHVRRALAELELAGLVERRSLNGKPLSQGNIAIYCWAIPREGFTGNEPKGTRAATFFAILSPSYAPLVSFAKAYKLPPPKDCTDESMEAARGYFDEAMVAIAQAENTRKVAIAKVETAFAQATANKEESNGKEHERNSTAAAVVSINEPLPSSSAVSTPAVVTTLPPEKAEEEDREAAYKQFKTAYPPERFDEPKAKPSFEGKTKTQQVRILERLHLYMACGRWQDEGGRWIPFASKWLESYDADPPPALKKTKSATTEADHAERLRRLAAEVEEDRKWR